MENKDKKIEKLFEDYFTEVAPSPDTLRKAKVAMRKKSEKTAPVKRKKLIVSLSTAFVAIVAIVSVLLGVLLPGSDGDYDSMYGTTSPSPSVSFESLNTGEINADIAKYVSAKREYNASSLTINKITYATANELTSSDWLTDYLSSHAVNVAHADAYAYYFKDTDVLAFVRIDLQMINDTREDITVYVETVNCTCSRFNTSGFSKKNGYNATIYGRIDYENGEYVNQNYFAYGDLKYYVISESARKNSADAFIIEILG